MKHSWRGYYRNRKAAAKATNYIIPESWSDYARIYANRIMNVATYEINLGRSTYEKEQAFIRRTISNSVYETRHILLNRAAKRLHRKGWV